MKNNIFEPVLTYIALPKLVKVNADVVHWNAIIWIWGPKCLSPQANVEFLVSEGLWESELGESSVNKFFREVRG